MISTEHLAAGTLIGLAALATAFALTALHDWAGREVQRHITLALGPQAEPPTTDEWWPWMDTLETVLHETTPIYNQLNFERWENEMEAS